LSIGSPENSLTGFDKQGIHAEDKSKFFGAVMQRIAQETEQEDSTHFITICKIDQTKSQVEDLLYSDDWFVKIQELNSKYNFIQNNQTNTLDEA
jgi:hypothetical protein